MTIKEATKRIEELEAELKRVNDHRDQLRDIAKRYIGANQRLRYERDWEIEKHERVTAIIAEMNG
jgi:hypothetical protein